jgi:hypothetical protein
MQYILITSLLVITHDIMKEIKRHKITNVGTMQALSRELPGFDYGPLKLQGKPQRVVHGFYDDFLKFLEVGVDKMEEEK